VAINGKMRFKRRNGNGNRRKKERRSIAAKQNGNGNGNGKNNGQKPPETKTVAILPKKTNSSNAGRKSKYNEDFPLLAEGFAREGLNDKEIAAKLGVNVATYYEYQNKYPEFLEALKRGKGPVDTKVENALLKRALGFTYEEDSLEYETPAPTEENPNPKPIVVKAKKIHKTAVPDTRAQEFWLRNRRPKVWRDEQKLTIQNDKPLSIEQMRKSLKETDQDEARK